MVSLTPIIDFVFGKLTNIFWTVVLFMALNCIADFIKVRKFTTWLTDEAKKIFAYTIFVSVGNRIDDLAIDKLFGWEGSTQLLVTLGLLVKEIRFLIAYAEAMGYQMPDILNQRLKDMEKQPTHPEYLTNTDKIDDQISKLQKDLEKLKTLKGLEDEVSRLKDGSQPVEPEPQDPYKFPPFDPIPKD